MRNAEECLPTALAGKIIRWVVSVLPSVSSVSLLNRLNFDLELCACVYVYIARQHSQEHTSRSKVDAKVCVLREYTAASHKY